MRSSAAGCTASDQPGVGARGREEVGGQAGAYGEAELTTPALGGGRDDRRPDDDSVAAPAHPPGATGRRTPPDPPSSSSSTPSPLAAPRWPWHRCAVHAVVAMTSARDQRSLRSPNHEPSRAGDPPPAADEGRPRRRDPLGGPAVVPALGGVVAPANRLRPADPGGRCQQQGLAGDAGDVRALAADAVLLDDGDGQPRAGQPLRDRLAAGAGAEDDDDVLVGGHGGPQSTGRTAPTGTPPPRSAAVSWSSSTAASTPRARSAAAMTGGRAR